MRIEARAGGVARFWPVLALATFVIALGLILRLVLWWQFGRHGGVNPAELGWVLPAGAVSDGVQSLYLLAPYTLYIALLPDRWYRTTANRWILTAGTVLSIFGLLYLAVIEYYFFQEFNARFNLVAVDYLAYPNEVIGDIRAEYPVGVVFMLAAAAALLIFYGLRARWLRGTDVSVRFRARAHWLAGFVVALSAAVAGFSTDQLGRSPNRVANEIEANGASSFFHAFRTSELDYREHYRTMNPKLALAAVSSALAPGGGRFVALDAGRLDREFAADPAGFGRMNVIVVSSESFGADFSRLYGSENDWTPNFDRYAQQALWFSNMYATGTRTVRGLEAITASFPPIPSKSILRRPNNEHIATWGRVMRDNGYDTSFIYGGFGYFDNMNYFYAENGFNVVDRRDIENVRFANIWGVSDEDLFDHALGYVDRQAAAGKPFFSIIMTTSNHKPYTFRAGVPGVQEEGGGRRSGVRYADFALGEFLKHAESHRWFSNTVFVVVADHGARVYGEARIPLKSYRIPLMIYAPAHIRPRRVDSLTTQIDIAPTVLGLLGLPYKAPFFGQNALRAAALPRVAVFSHNNDVALYRDGEMVILGLHRGAESYRYDPATDRYAEAPPNPALEQLAIAYFQVAFDLFRDHRYE